jgi:serine/threonine protein kinase
MAKSISRNLTAAHWDSSSSGSFDASQQPVNAASLNPFLSGKGGANFVHGRPVCLAAWLSVRKPGTWGFAGKHSRFVKLHGEVLSLRKQPHCFPTAEFNIFDATVRCSWNSKSARSFRLVFREEELEFKCKTYEEMIIWARSVKYAAARSFQKFYILGKKIAEGRHSKVYFAYPRNSKTPNVYAVKVIRRTFDLESKERVEREVRIASSLEAHSHIVAAVDVFASTTIVHIVMEHMQGDTLANMLLEYPVLSEMYARPVLLHMLKGLAYIHGENIVHRDIRPENIFCSEKRFPMELAIGDFGIANVIPDYKVNNNVLTTMTIGDLSYIAPEMASGQNYGPAIDMWSVGVVLYRILSGSMPFVGCAGDIMRAVRRCELDTNSAFWATVSPEATSLLRQLLHIDPFKRITAQAAANHQWFEPQRSLVIRRKLDEKHPFRKMLVVAKAFIAVARLSMFASGRSITLRLNKSDRRLYLGDISDGSERGRPRH